MNNMLSKRERVGPHNRGNATSRRSNPNPLSNNTLSKPSRAGRHNKRNTISSHGSPGYPAATC